MFISVLPKLKTHCNWCESALAHAKTKEFFLAVRPSFFIGLLRRLEGD